MLKYILLGFLSYRPMTGYEIDHWMSHSTGYFWHAKLSQIYTTLKKMEAEALIISHLEPQTGRPDRVVYELTETGRQALHAWQQDFMVAPELKKDSLLVKVFFATPADKDTLLTQLKLQLELHHQQKEKYEQETPQVIGTFLQAQPELLPQAALWQLTQQYGVLYETMYITWLQQAIAYIEQQL